MSQSIFSVGKEMIRKANKVLFKCDNALSTLNVVLSEIKDDTGLIDFSSLTDRIASLVGSLSAACQAVRQEVARLTIAQAGEAITIDAADIADWAWKEQWVIDLCCTRYSLAINSDWPRLLKHIDQYPYSGFDQIQKKASHLLEIEGEGVVQWANRRIDISAARPGSAEWHRRRNIENELYYELKRDTRRLLADRVWEAINYKRNRVDELVAERRRAYLKMIIDDCAHRMESESQNCERLEAMSRSLIARWRSGMEVHRVAIELATIESTARPAPNIDASDLKVACVWAHAYGGSPYNMNTMISARCAEKFMADMYRSMGANVTDISITQASGVHGDLWKIADLDVDGDLVDVKNARRSYSSSATYSEHIVKKFKVDSSHGAVRIAGVISNYVKYVDDDGVLVGSVKPGELIWLGEMSKNDMSSLKHEFDSEYLTVFRSRQDTNVRIAPWLFSYPATKYRQLREYAELLASDMLNEGIRSISQPLALLMVQYGAYPLQLRSTVHAETRLLYNRIVSKRLTLPRLFVHILDRFCWSVVNGVEFAADAIADAIFPLGPQSEQETLYPLYMTDPLQTVWELLDVLPRAMRLCGPALRDYKSFRLGGSGILQGVLPDGWAHSLIAYCGGWRDDYNVKCGNAPLYLGHNELCSRCGRLVCDACGYCTQGCGRSRTRRVRPNTRQRY